MKKQSKEFGEPRLFTTGLLKVFKVLTSCINSPEVDTARGIPPNLLGLRTLFL